MVVANSALTIESFTNTNARANWFTRAAQNLTLFSFPKEGVCRILRRLPPFDGFSAASDLAFKERNAFGKIGLGHGV
jgi:hypothetical protein